MNKSKKKRSTKATIVTLAVMVIWLMVAKVFAAESVERDRYLLLDSRIIEKTVNAKLTVGTVQKDKSNPLFKEDKPWEPRYDNVYCNVIYDEQEKLYKCWYSPFIIDERTTSTPTEKRNPESQDYMSSRPRGREMGVCYAVSKDGIHWEKPELGLVEFNGNKKNNILMRGYHFKGVFTGPHGAGVFKDLHESDLAKRYKMFFKGSKMAVAFSPDGLHWSVPIECPEIDAHGDTHNNAFWAPDMGKYIGITRLKGGSPRIRQVAWTESKDFVNWTKAEVVLEGVKPRLQTHDMVVFPIGGVYIGLLGMMDFPNAKSNFHTKQHVELAWSPDSKEWHRIQPGTPFIGHTPAKKEVYGKMPYDWGTIFASAPIFREDEIQIYYGACDWYFFDWRKGYLALGTLRPDGWAGYEQIEKAISAIVTTKTIPITGNILGVSADVEKNGFVKVTILDKNDKLLAESEPIKQTVTDGRVKWQDRFSIEKVKGKDVRLKFELKDAKLYSFGFDLKSQAKIDLALSKSVVDSKEDVERIVAELIEQKKEQEAVNREKERAEQRRRTQSPEEQVPGYLAELNDANPRVRENAADQLAKIGLRVKDETALLPAVAPLVAAMSDDDMEVRDESAEALGVIASRIKDEAAVKSAVAVLVAGLSDKYAEVREECAEALGRIASRVKDKAADLPVVARLAEPSRDRRLRRGRFLVLDSRIIDKTINARLRLGKVKKHPSNPLFGEDKPWEKRFDNLYPSVIYDPDDKLYKLWYNPFIKDRAVDTIPREKYATTPYNDGLPREMGMCYAFSKDGIKWEKPELGLVEYDGSKQNNIVWRKPHGAGVFKDLHDPDPARRYKTLFKQRKISVGFSVDGINWGPQIMCQEIDPKPADGTHYNALWVPELGKYVGFIRFRGREGRRTPVEQNGRSRAVRQVGRTTSKDFLNWTQAKLVFEGSDVNLQVYSMPVFRYAGLYLGLPVMYNYTTDRAFTGLAWSPDTINWHFIAEGTPLIANSEKKGDYDWGCAYSSAYPIFLDKEIRLYYGASDGLHFGWRNGFFCLATLRPDGWAGYEPVDSDQPAVIKIKPVVCTGKDLQVCADVEKKGYVKIKLLDSDNKLLAESKPIKKTVPHADIQWKAGFSLEGLRGKNVKIEFELKNARLFSFAFDPKS